MSRLTRIYNPLDTDEILEKAKQPTDNYSFSSEIPTFIAIGTVYPAKGYDRLLAVHKKLLLERHQHRILIIGDGNSFDKISKLKTKLQIEQTVEMLGFTDNPYPYLKYADYFILSSRYEGFPTVLFEAITLKKKIIATDVSGVKEMLEDGKLGLVVENSEDGIYEGMKKALENPKNFKIFDERLKSYEMPFELENSVQSIVKIIDEL
jgi:glycosyltransferase involved in cell wall biosynthesis